MFFVAVMISLNSYYRQFFCFFGLKLVNPSSYSVSKDELSRSAVSDSTAMMLPPLCFMYKVVCLDLSA